MSDLKLNVHREDGHTIFQSVQDCTPILERAQMLHKSGAHGSKDVKHAAHLPAILVEKYCNDKGITFAEFLNRKEGHVRAMLNDKSLEGFRVWKGNV